MSGGASITVDMPDLRRQLHRYSEVSKKTFVEICDAKGLDLAFKALEQTEKADQSKIEHTLGQIGNALKFTKKGAIRKGKNAKGARLIAEISFAGRIINARRVKKGEKPLSGDALKEEAAKLINARVRTIGFFKAGWLPAIRKLAAIAKDRSIAKSARASGAKAYKKPKGRATAARYTLSPFTEIVNSATKDSPAAAAKIAAALTKAAAIVTADMEVYITRKMNEATKKAGAQ